MKFTKKYRHRCDTLIHGILCEHLFDQAVVVRINESSMPEFVALRQLKRSDHMRITHRAQV